MNRSQKHWTAEEINFIKSYYGKVKTDAISEVLGRSNSAIFNKCKELEIRIQPHLYQKEPLTVTFQGIEYKLTCFRYKKMKSGSTVDQTRRLGVKGRPRLHPIKIKEPMSAHRRKPELKPKKANNKEQEKELQEFEAPQGKKLVQINKKTWVYR